MDKNKRWELDLRDFRVKYRFFTPAEGGRENPVLQGYRSDWGSMQTTMLHGRQVIKKTPYRSI